MISGKCPHCSFAFATTVDGAEAKAYFAATLVEHLRTVHQQGRPEAEAEAARIVGELGPSPTAGPGQHRP